MHYIIPTLTSGRTFLQKGYAVKGKVVRYLEEDVRWASLGRSTSKEDAEGSVMMERNESVRAKSSQMEVNT